MIFLAPTSVDPEASGGSASLPRSFGFAAADLASAAALRAGPALTGSVLPFVLVLYLALKGGGYDIVPRSQVAIAVWWILLLGCAIGLLPVARVTRAGWVGICLLGGFVVWTALGISWSSSSERSVAELGLVAAYFGFF